MTQESLVTSQQMVMKRVEETLWKNFFRRTQHKQGDFMNKSKMISATALATVMSATAASAEMSVFGFATGYWTTSSAATGSTLGASSETMGVSYSGTMDNGMGLGMTINTYGSATDTTDVALSVSSDMGSLSFGSAQNSAADAMDGMPGKAGFGLAGTDTIVAKDYSDGDDATGHGIQYTSPSFSGWTVAASTGFSSTQGVDATTSLAVRGSIAGVSLAAGIASIGVAPTAQSDVVIGSCVVINDAGTGTTRTAMSSADATCTTGTIERAWAAAVPVVVNNNRDDTFITAAYSLGDISLGYGLYSADSATGDSASSISVSMPFAGMTAGIQYGEADNSGANADDDGYRIGLVKSMGAGASFAVEYTDVTTGATDDDNPTSFRVGYMVAF
jgi:hypothetical protein